MTKVWGVVRGVGLAGTVVVGLCGLLVAGGAVGGCGSSGRVVVTGGTTAATREAPTALFRQWQLVRTSGGIGGGGYPVTPGTNLLTFNANGSFSRAASGQVTQGTYQVAIRETSVGQGALPVISYSAAGLDEVITEVSDQKLVLVEEAADGFTREYAPVVIAVEVAGGR